MIHKGLHKWNPANPYLRGEWGLQKLAKREEEISNKNGVGRLKKREDSVEGGMLDFLIALSANLVYYTLTISQTWTDWKLNFFMSLTFPDFYHCLIICVLEQSVMCVLEQCH